ncbi:hypothetical protein NDU88_004864 [Pleurodeles waltl]|uniref:Uncharacterized protein n=1 Tax=Pleurodeles waltl TaxID=8319 RepID=A0AAV7NQJ6_PLEWA|nr:hypothetical protein NDU88_004864 [Pleurodeles waltl]
MMSKEKGAKAAQSNKINQYTVPGHGPQESGPGDLSSQGPEEQFKATAEILAAIQGTRATLENKRDTMAIELNLLLLDRRKVAKRVTCMEEEVITLKREIKYIQTTVAGLKCSAMHMEEHIDDTEGCSSRNYICLIEFPKQAEGLFVELSLEDWIFNMLKPERLSKFFTIERTHRALAMILHLGAPPGALIALLFNYKDNNVILQHLQSHSPPRYEDKWILIFPDYTWRVHYLRKNFMHIKKLLQDHIIKYILMFPAKLLIQYSGRDQSLGLSWEQQNLDEN